MDEKKFGKSKSSRRRLESKIVSAPIEASEADLIERVLEHISSPFCWELIDESASKLAPHPTASRGNEKLS